MGSPSNSAPSVNLTSHGEGRGQENTDKLSTCPADVGKTHPHHSTSSLIGPKTSRVGDSLPRLAEDLHLTRCSLVLGGIFFLKHMYTEF
jgi:hypothetical protein